VLVGAECWNQKQYASGLITVAWRQDERELVTQVDNDWNTAWTFRLKIPAERFDRPFDPYVFAKSTPEHRDGCDLYPMLGLNGYHKSLYNYDGIKTAKDFLNNSIAAGGHQAIVVYLLQSSGGIPADLKYDNKSPTG